MLPYLEGGIIHFAEGLVNIDRCIVSDLKKLFGEPLVVHGQGNKNELAFRWQLGAIRAFPLPTERFHDQSQIHLLHLVLTEEVPLKDLILQYGCQPACYFVQIEEEEEHFAIFSLRLQAKYYPASNLVKVLGFVNLDHIQTCTCPECTLIRQEVKKVKPLSLVRSQFLH